MKIDSKKILMIVIIIISVLLVVGGAVFGYLYIATDTFKSSKELFEKFAAQNIEAFTNIKNSNTYNIYKNLENESVYESITKMNMSYSQGGEVSNPFNDLSIQLKTQKEDNYIYRDAQILFKDEEYLEIEGIKDNDVYGIRFSDVLRPFLSVRNNSEVMIPDELGLDVDMVQQCIALIDGNMDAIDNIISKEEIQILKDRYFNIILQNISNGTYTKQRKTMITLNNKTIQTNAYIVTLNKDQVQTLIEQLLNNIKTDEIILNKIRENSFIDEEEFIKEIDETLENLGIDKEIPTIKVIVYEQKGVTVRTIIEIGLNKYIIENSNQNGQLKTKIQRSVLNNEQQEEQTIEIIKEGTDNEEKYDIKLDVVEGEKNYSVEFILNMTSNNETINTIGTISYLENITNIEMTIENTINKTEFGEKVVLDATNNIILNDLEKETRDEILNKVKTGVPERINIRVQALIEQLQIKEELEKIMQEISNKLNNEEEQNPDITPGDFEEEQIPQVEINRFNAKFEFYTGDSVSADNVRTLLDVVKDNLNSVEITPIETIDENNKEEIKENIKLNIEKDKQNIELANGILEKIEDKKKYKVEISYKNENGLIDYINISEVEK